MPQIGTLFPGEPERNNTPRRLRKHHNRSKTQTASTRNVRRQSLQRMSGGERFNLKRNNKRSPHRRCDEKREFNQKRDARSSSDSYMYEICLTFDPMVPYYCSHHSKWHIGHDSRFPQDRRAEYHAECVKRVSTQKLGRNFKKRNG
jgi:hypothetical protein